MNDNLDFTKVGNSHIKPLEFDVIVLAVGGDPPVLGLLS